MITIKTLLHSLKAERVEGADMCLSLYLNDGWEILNIASNPETSLMYAERIVTLKFESRDIEPPPLFGVYTQAIMGLPRLPSDVIDAYRALYAASIEHVSLEGNPRETRPVMEKCQADLIKIIASHIPDEAKS